MKNLKRALSMVLASAMLFGMMVVGTSAFDDVTAEHDVEAIEVMEAAGIMIGDDKGYFNADQVVTRAEMAVVMTNLLGVKAADYVGTHPFTDVPAWADGYVGAAYANNITSGTGPDTFSPNAPVTAAESALMLMKALGYFQNPQDFEDDWMMATMKQAAKIELNDGVDAAAKAGLTRNFVATMTLNALQADVVDGHGSKGTNITTSDGTQINVGYEVEYSTEPAGDAQYVIGGTSAGLQLTEKLFDAKLTKQTTVDKFQNKATKWSWKNKEIGTYTATPDLVYTAETKSETIYDEAGLNTNLTATVYENGASDGTFAVEKDNDTAKIGGNGVVMNVYLTKDPLNGVVTGVKIVKIETVFGEISSVGKNSDEERIVRVKDTSKTFVTEDFAKEDLVVYTYVGNEVQTMEKVEKMTGTVAKVVGSKFVIDGTEYKVNAANTGNVTYTGVVGEAVDFYVDQYGYIVKLEASEDTIDLSNLAYVINAADARGDYAELRLADGSKMTVDTDDDYSSLIGKIVSFKETEDGYKLTNKSGTTATGATYADDTATMGGYDVNNKTTFLYAIDNGSEVTYKSYTGYKNAPVITGAGADITGYAETGKAATWIYVDVDSTDVDDVLSDVVVIVYDNDVNKVTEKDVESYYEFAAIVDGEITTLKLHEDDWASETAFGAIADSISVDSDGVYSNPVSCAEAAATTITFSEGVLKIGGTQKQYADDVDVYLVSDDQAVTTIDLSGIQKDDNSTDNNPYANVLYALDNGKVAVIVLFENEI